MDYFIIVQKVILAFSDSNNGAIEELKKQINDIIQELNLLKEQQALQTGNASDIRTMDTSRWLKKYYVT